MAEEDKELKHGAVLITKGEHEGKNGYYDDDEGDKAIVYLGEPFSSDYILIDHENIKSITLLSHEKYKRNNEKLCAIVGIS